MSRRLSAHGPTHRCGPDHIDVSGLRSGNGLYDAELLRRIDARRFPTATVDLRSCAASGLGPATTSKGPSPSTA